eukprot:3940861-Heterocapsa_arctica.AAC.1
MPEHSASRSAGLRAQQLAGRPVGQSAGRRARATPDGTAGWLARANRKPTGMPFMEGALGKGAERRGAPCLPGAAGH